MNAFANSLVGAGVACPNTSTQAHTGGRTPTWFIAFSASLECVRNRPCWKIRPPVFPDAKGCVTGCPCGAMRWNIAERPIFIVERLNFRQNNAKMHAMQPPSHTRARTYARERIKKRSPLLPRHAPPSIARHAGFVIMSGRKI